jgi:zinc transporter ZupT
MHALEVAARSLHAMVFTSGAGVIGGLVGAVAGGALGPMIGFAVAAWIGALMSWWQLRAALQESGRDPAKSFMLSEVA